MSGAFCEYLLPISTLQGRRFFTVERRLGNARQIFKQVIWRLASQIFSCQPA
jgi:hypothetical protein